MTGIVLHVRDTRLGYVGDDGVLVWPTHAVNNAIYDRINASLMWIAHPDGVSRFVVIPPQFDTGDLTFSFEGAGDSDGVYTTDEVSDSDPARYIDDIPEPVEPEHHKPQGRGKHK